MSPVGHDNPQVPSMRFAPVGKHVCPVCEERFKTVGDKKRHIREKHPPGGIGR